MLAFLLTALLSCGKEEAGISNVPNIAFESVELVKNVDQKDSVVRITFSFKDGDGDIGLGDTDTIPPFNRASEYWQNAAVTILHQVGGNFEELLNPGTNEPFDLPSERIPRITPEGKNKTISGKISIHMPANPLNTQPQKVKYQIRLIDRALNISNMVETPELELTH